MSDIDHSYYHVFLVEENLDTSFVVGQNCVGSILIIGSYFLIQLKILPACLLSAVLLKWLEYCLFLVPCFPPNYFSSSS